MPPLTHIVIMALMLLAGGIMGPIIVVKETIEIGKDLGDILADKTHELLRDDKSNK